MAVLSKGIIVLALSVMVAGCASSVPESNRGVGFGDPIEFERQRLAREAALTGSGTTNFGPPSAVQTQAIPSSDLAAAGIGQGAGPGGQVGAPLSALDPSRTQGVQASPTNAAPELQNNPGISDEQDFSAVSSRESIESDAQRRAAQAAQREVIAPTALPTRPADTGPNIVEFALNAPNRKGQEWYSRSILSGQGRFQRNCATYNSPDAAQRDFLARGGPERDPRGIDPDGDGFACGWDPAPFLLAAGN